MFDFALDLLQERIFEAAQLAHDPHPVDGPKLKNHRHGRKRQPVAGGWGYLDGVRKPERAQVARERHDHDDGRRVHGAVIVKNQGRPAPRLLPPRATRLRQFDFDGIAAEHAELHALDGLVAG